MRKVKDILLESYCSLYFIEIRYLFGSERKRTMQEVLTQQYFLLLIILIRVCDIHRSLRFTNIFHITYIYYSYTHHLIDEVLEAQRNKWDKIM